MTTNSETEAKGAVPELVVDVSVIKHDDDGKQIDDEGGEKKGERPPRVPKEPLKVGDVYRTKEVLEIGVKGVVKWFNVMKGYGFVNRTDLDQDIFVHRSGIRFASRVTWPASLGDGEEVEFTVVKGNNREEAVMLTGRNETDVRGSEYALPYRFRFLIFRKGGPYVGPPPPSPAMFARGYKYSREPIPKNVNRYPFHMDREADSGEEKKDGRKGRRNGRRRNRQQRSGVKIEDSDGITPAQRAAEPRRRRSSDSEEETVDKPQRHRRRNGQRHRNPAPKQDGGDESQGEKGAGETQKKGRRNYRKNRSKSNQEASEKVKGEKSDDGTMKKSISDASAKVVTGSGDGPKSKVVGAELASRLHGIHLNSGEP